MLIEDLRDSALPLYRQGRFDTAVFEAFKSLEVAVCVFQPIVDAHFSRSWTAIQPSVDAVSEHRGRRFTVIVDDWGARK